MEKKMKTSAIKKTLPTKSETKESYTKEEFAALFPDVDPGHKPYGTRILLQLRSARERSKGGILLTTGDQEVEKWNTQVGIVRAIGPVAFMNRDTLESWPEKAWCKVGSFVRIPKYNQDRWEVKRGDHSVLFMLVKDVDLLAEVTGNPLEVKAFI